MKFKLDEIKIDKKLRDMDSINPLTMKIEDIIKLPEDLPITVANENDDIPKIVPAVNAKELAIAEQKDKIMENIRWILGGKMEYKEVEFLIQDLFIEEFEQDTWLNQYERPEKQMNIKKLGGGIDI